MLYESSQETVLLVNEIAHINNYLDLEKIRYSDTDFIDFKISGEYSKILIPPLIFMPFIENAFKHGNRLCPVPGIKIKIDVLDSDETQSRNSGFGLANIRRRLDLLFDNKYELNIANENNTYSVKLNLIIL
jgi:sensor histidine kinase YesM